MKDFTLLIELHKNHQRQGPGSKESTLKAFDLTGFSKKDEIKILDIGCGTGAQTIDLAQNTHASIIAVDYFPVFLEKLENKARKLNVLNKITPLQASMDQLELPKHSFDLIWSEGAVYIMGFSKAVKYFKEYLQPKGVIAFSEICWFTNHRPAEIDEYWNTYYEEMGTIEDKIKILADNGFDLLGQFNLPEDNWLENYYKPLQNTFPSFIKQFGEKAKEIVANEEKEIANYLKYKKYFGYGFFVARLKS